MTTDKCCHWNYALESIVGPVRSVTAKSVTHDPTRWDKSGEPYTAPPTTRLTVCELETPAGPARQARTPLLSRASDPRHPRDHAVSGLRLPDLNGAAVHHELQQPGLWRKPSVQITSRLACAAVHVFPRPLAENTPGAPAVVDWDTTLAYRHGLWAYGLGVADAMDTAQRGTGLDWPANSLPEADGRGDARLRAGGGHLLVQQARQSPTTARPEVSVHVGEVVAFSPR